MRNTINKTESWTKRDDINSRTAQSLQDVEEGATLTVSAISKVETDEGSDDTLKHVTCFRTSDNQYVSTISQSIYDSANDYIDILEEEGSLTLIVHSRTAKSGRMFLALTVV